MPEHGNSVCQVWQRDFLQKIRQLIGKGADQLLHALLSTKAIDQYGKELDEYRAELFKKEYLPRVKGFPKYASCSRESSGTTSELPGIVGEGK